MNLDFPFHFNNFGRTVETDDLDHIRDMIEELLFTNPGERVNRPDFGCGLSQLVFAPNSDELAASVQFLIKGALQMWLGNLILVESVQVAGQESTLTIDIQYIVRQSQTRTTAQFSQGGV